MDYVDGIAEWKYRHQHMESLDSTDSLYSNNSSSHFSYQNEDASRGTTMDDSNDEEDSIVSTKFVSLPIKKKPIHGWRTDTLCHPEEPSFTEAYTTRWLPGYQDYFLSSSPSSPSSDESHYYDNDEDSCSSFASTVASLEEQQKQFMLGDEQTVSPQQLLHDEEYEVDDEDDARLHVLIEEEEEEETHMQVAEEIKVAFDFAIPSSSPLPDIVSQMTPSISGIRLRLQPPKEEMRRSERRSSQHVRSTIGLAMGLKKYKYKN